MKIVVFWVVAPVDWYKFTDVSEICPASIIRAMNEGRTDLCNVGKLIPVCTTLQSRRQTTSKAPVMCHKIEL
jgi:hypothetical protein